MACRAGDAGNGGHLRTVTGRNSCCCLSSSATVTVTSRASSPLYLLSALRAGSKWTMQVWAPSMEESSTAVTVMRTSRCQLPVLSWAAVGKTLHSLFDALNGMVTALVGWLVRVMVKVAELLGSLTARLSGSTMIPASSSSSTVTNMSGGS